MIIRVHDNNDDDVNDDDVDDVDVDDVDGSDVTYGDEDGADYLALDPPGGYARLQAPLRVGHCHPVLSRNQKPVLKTF